MFPNMSVTDSRYVRWGDIKSLRKFNIAFRAHSDLFHIFFRQKGILDALTPGGPAVGRSVSGVLQGGSNRQVMGIDAPMIPAQVASHVARSGDAPTGEYERDNMHPPTYPFPVDLTVSAGITPKGVHDTFGDSFTNAGLNSIYKPVRPGVHGSATRVGVAVYVKAPVMTMTEPPLVSGFFAPTMRAGKFGFLALVRLVIAGATQSLSQVFSSAVKGFTNTIHRGTPLGLVRVVTSS